MTFNNGGFELDFELLEEQSNDLDDGEQNLEDEANEMLKSWNRDKLMQEVSEEKKRLKLEEENSSVDYYDGETDFDQIISRMTPLDEGNVYIKVIEPNPTGREIKSSHTILFDRVGYLEHEIVPFDSSIYDGKPTKLSLMDGPILPGMLRALISLREGERANILIRPSMAYGPLGCLPLVPEEATLLYNVKIHKVWDESQLSAVLDYERSNMLIVPLADKIALVEEHKEIANAYLRDDVPREAILRYKAAIKCIDEVGPEHLDGSNHVSKLMITLLQNVSIAFNKTAMYKSATKAAKRAISMDPSSLKAYYQLAKARIGLADYSGATKWISMASKISPNNKSFDQLKLQLNSQYREEREKRDEIMRKMSRACQ